MTIKKSALSCFIIAMLILGINSAQTDPSWQTNQLIQAGVVTIVSTSNYQQGNKYGPYNVTYSPAFSTPPYSGLGIVMIDSNPSQIYLQFLLNIQDFTNTNKLQIMMNLVSVNWNNFKVSYIATDSSLSYIIVNYIDKTFTAQSVATGIGARIYDNYFALSQSVDMSHDISVIPYVTGLQLSTAAGFIFKLQTVKFNSSHIHYIVYANGTTNVTRFVSYLLVYDKTLGSNTQQIFLDNLQIQGTNNVLDPNSLVFAAPSNLLVGFSGFNVNYFNFQFNPAALDVTSNSLFNYIDFSFWSFRKRVCQPLTPYYQVNANKCLDICPASYYKIDPQQYCQLCSTPMPNCQVCDSQILCTQCSPLVNLINDTNTGGAYCGCELKYYVVGDHCETCNIQCQTCSGPNNNDCLTCDQITRTLNATFCSCIHGVHPNGVCMTNCSQGCLLCPSDINTCTLCQQSFQLGGGKCRCLSGAYYDSSLFVCKACDPTCFLCSGPSLTECLACDASLKRELNTTTFQCNCSATYYDPGNLTCIKQPMDSTGVCASGFYLNLEIGFCSQICGDGKLFQIQCDDGNLDNGDGCDQNCLQQPEFSCLYGNSTSPSICSYNGSIQFQLKISDKSLFTNQVDLVYQLKPFLKFYSLYPYFISYVSFNDSTVSVNYAEYDSFSKRLRIRIQYNQTITLRNLKLSFTPPNNAYTHAVKVSSSGWKAKASNGLSLAYYDNSDYQSAQILSYLSLVIIILAQFFFCLSLFFRKMIGLQLMSLIQIQFISFALLSYSSPILGPILTWKYVFGYNQWAPEAIINQNQMINSNFSALGFKSYFGYNVNYMIFVIASFYAISLLLFGISFVTSKSQSKKFRDASIIFARQIGFGLMALCVCNIIISLFLQYDLQILLSISPMWSFLLKISSVLIITVNIVVFILSYKQSVQSYIFYKKDDSVGQRTPVYLVIRNILVSAGIYMGTYFDGYSIYGSILIQSIYLGFIIWRQPFKRYIDIGRSITIQGGILFILLSRMVETLFYDPMFPGAVGSFSQFSNYFQHIITTVCLGLTIASFIIHFVKASKKQSQIYPELLDQVQIFSEMQKNSSQRAKKQQKQMFKPFFDQKEKKDKTKQPIKDSRAKLGQKLLFSMDQIDNSNTSLGNINTQNGSFAFDHANSKRKLKQNQSDDIIIDMD